MLRNRAAQPTWKFSMEFSTHYFHLRCLPCIFHLEVTALESACSLAWEHPGLENNLPGFVGSRQQWSLTAERCRPSQRRYNRQFDVGFFFLHYANKLLHSHLSVWRYKTSKNEFAFTKPRLLQSSIFLCSAKGTFLRSVWMYPACLVIFLPF